MQICALGYTSTTVRDRFSSSTLRTPATGREKEFKLTKRSKPLAESKDQKSESFEARGGRNKRMSIFFFLEDSVYNTTNTRHVDFLDASKCGRRTILYVRIKWWQGWGFLVLTIYYKDMNPKVFAFFCIFAGLNGLVNPFPSPVKHWSIFRKE